MQQEQRDALRSSITHDGAEEMDHGILCSTLTWGSGRGFLRGGRESTSERSLRGKGSERGRRKGTAGIHFYYAQNKHHFALHC